MRDYFPEFDEIRQPLLLMLAQLRCRTSTALVRLLPTREARGQAFLHLRPRFEVGADPWYFSTDRRGIPSIRLYIKDGEMRGQMMLERVEPGFFAVN